MRLYTVAHTDEEVEVDEEVDLIRRARPEHLNPRSYGLLSLN